MTGSLFPDEQTEILRTYCRQRLNWIEQAAQASRKIQKFLKLLNFRLAVVVRDICGLAGMKIIQDICAGNLDAVSLAKHRHYNCRKSEEEIAKALKGNQPPAYLLGLKQEYESYAFLQEKIAECDQQISQLMKAQIETCPEKKPCKPLQSYTKEKIRMPLLA